MSDKESKRSQRADSWIINLVIVLAFLGLIGAALFKKARDTYPAPLYSHPLAVFDNDEHRIEDPAGWTRYAVAAAKHIGFAADDWKIVGLAYHYCTDAATFAMGQHGLQISLRHDWSAESCDCMEALPRLGKAVDADLARIKQAGCSASLTPGRRPSRSSSESVYDQAARCIQHLRTNDWPDLPMAAINNRLEREETCRAQRDEKARGEVFIARGSGITSGLVDDYLIDTALAQTLSVTAPSSGPSAVELLRSGASKLLELPTPAQTAVIAGTLAYFKGAIAERDAEALQAARQALYWKAFSTDTDDSDRDALISAREAALEERQRRIFTALSHLADAVEGAPELGSQLTRGIEGTPDADYWMSHLEILGDAEHPLHRAAANALVPLVLGLDGKDLESGP